MSASGVLLKGCNLELCLNGSRPVFVDTYKTHNLPSALSTHHVSSAQGITSHTITPNQIPTGQPLLGNPCANALYDKLHQLSLTSGYSTHHHVNGVHPGNNFKSSQLPLHHPPNSNGGSFSTYPRNNTELTRTQLLSRITTTETVHSNQTDLDGTDPLHVSQTRPASTDTQLSSECREVLSSEILSMTNRPGSHKTKDASSFPSQSTKRRPKKSKKSAKSCKHRPKSRKPSRSKTKQVSETSAISPAMVQLEAFCKPLNVLVNAPRTKPSHSASVASNTQSNTTPTRPMQNLRLPKTNATGIIIQPTNNQGSSMTNLKPPKVTPRQSAEYSTNHSHEKKFPTKAEVGKVCKVYLSDRQSNMMKELGVEMPCAPPATPLPELHKNYEYVPCLNDIRSQRAVRVRLEAMEKIEKKKQDKLFEERIKLEKVSQKEYERLHRKQQRLEIYALNSMMTALEWKNFQEFCEKNGLNP